MGATSMSVPKALLLLGVVACTTSSITAALVARRVQVHSHTFGLHAWHYPCLLTVVHHAGCMEKVELDLIIIKLHVRTVAPFSVQLHADGGSFLRTGTGRQVRGHCDGAGCHAAGCKRTCCAVRASCTAKCLNVSK